MTLPRSPVRPVILGLTCIILVASVWHLKPWDSVDLPSSLKASLGSMHLGAIEASPEANHVDPEMEIDNAMNKPTANMPGSAEDKSSESAAAQYCKWIFDKYESSAYEEQWFQEVPQVQSTTKSSPNICQAMLADRHVAAAKAIVGRVMELTSIDSKIQWKTYDAMPTIPPHPADDYMSRMHYRRVCYNPQKQRFDAASGKGIQLIEPLFGMLRDPFDLYCFEERLTMENYTVSYEGQSKVHIMPQGFAPYAYTTIDGGVEPSEWRSNGIPPWHSSLRPSYNEHVGMAFRQPQNIHLDLGSSYFGGWTALGQKGKVNPAASGKWFYDTYHARGQKFDRFIAVEVEILNDTIAYEQIPDDLVGIYTLMNVPLSMRNDKLNTVEMIKRIVKPEDFFVFKLDIDSAPIEEPIVQSLLADDPENGGASALIDELMFEHHVNFYPMNQPWGLSSANGDHGDLMTSYNLFRGLRRKGIRAHSWP